MAFALLTIIWVLYAAYIFNKTESQRNDQYKHIGIELEENEILLAESSGNVQNYDSSNMDDKYRKEKFLSTQSLYSNGSDSNMCATSDEEMTELSTLTKGSMEESKKLIQRN